MSDLKLEIGKRYNAAATGAAAFIHLMKIELKRADT